MNEILSELPVEFLFRMTGDDAIGERNKFVGPIGGRYMSTPEGGGRFEGPRLAGDMLQGYSWAPHRSKGSDYGHMLYDTRLLLRTTDGHSILAIWYGTNSPTYSDGSWRVTGVFEAEDGPYAWLNEVVVIGVGKQAGLGVEYMFYEVTA